MRADVYNMGRILLFAYGTLQSLSSLRLLTLLRQLALETMAYRFLDARNIQRLIIAWS